MSIISGQNLSFFFAAETVADKSASEAVIVLKDMHIEVLKQIDYVRNVREITYEQLQSFYQSRQADSRCIRRRSEVEYAHKNNMPLKIFEYDVDIDVKVMLFSKKFTFHQIQSIIIDPAKNGFRVADVYSQLKRFDCFTTIEERGQTAEEKKLYLDLTVELDITKIIFLPKFLDTNMINKILEKLNILKLQREIVLDVMGNMIKNTVKLYSKMGIIKDIAANKLELQPQSIAGEAFNGKSWSEEYLFKPYWPIQK